MCRGSSRSSRQLTGDPVWSDRAAVAADFVAAMQSADGHVNTRHGTRRLDRQHPPDPLDAQTWSSLATGDPRYGAALDWTLANLIATDGPYTGPSISEVDVSKAWFEGGGHLALALKLRDGAGDADRAESLLSQHPSGAARRAQRRRQGHRPRRRTTASTPDSATSTTPACTPVRPRGTCSRQPGTTPSLCRSSDPGLRGDAGDRGDGAGEEVESCQHRCAWRRRCRGRILPRWRARGAASGRPRFRLRW